MNLTLVLLTFQKKHGCSKLMKHPLVISLLDYKWKKFGRYIFFGNLLIYLIFLVFLTAFALVIRSPVERPCKHILYKIFVCAHVMAMIHGTISRILWSSTHSLQMHGLFWSNFMKRKITLVKEALQGSLFFCEHTFDLVSGWQYISYHTLCVLRSLRTACLLWSTAKKNGCKESHSSGDFKQQGTSAHNYNVLSVKLWTRLESTWPLCWLPYK